MIVAPAHFADLTASHHACTSFASRDACNSTTECTTPSIGTVQCCDFQDIGRDTCWLLRDLPEEPKTGLVDGLNDCDATASLYDTTSTISRLIFSRVQYGDWFFDRRPGKCTSGSQCNSGICCNWVVIIEGVSRMLSDTIYLRATSAVHIARRGIPVQRSRTVCSESPERPRYIRVLMPFDEGVAVQ